MLLFSATPISHILHVDKSEKKGGRGDGKRRRVGQKQRKARFVPGRRERRKKKIMLAEGGRKKAKTGGE